MHYMLGVKGLKQLSSKSRGSKHTPYCVVLCSLIGYINRYGKMCFHSMGPNLALVFEVSAQETLAVMPPHRITQSEFVCFLTTVNCKDLMYIWLYIQVHIAIFMDCNCFINTRGSHLYIPATPGTSLLIEVSIGDFREQTCSKCKHEYTRAIIWRRHIMRAVKSKDCIITLSESSDTTGMWATVTSSVVKYSLTL